MEKIRVAELSIKPEKLIQELQKTKSEIDSLTKAQADMRKAGDTSNQTFIQNESRLKSLRGEYNSNMKVLTQVTDATKSLDKELNREIKSLDDAADNNKKLRKARSGLNLETEEGQKALKQINSQIDKNTDFMKENQDSQIQNKMNVGNYTDSILEATGASQAYSQATGVMTTVQKGYTMVVGQSTGAMKLFKVALASTGIGLIIIALGSLISYFTQTQEGINKVNMVLTPMKELFGELQGAVQEFGAALAKLFSGGTFKAFFKDMGAAGDKVADSFETAWKRGREIEKLKQNLSKTEADYISKQAELRREFEEQNKLADDQTKSAEERAAAAERAIAAQAEISKGSIERIKQEGEILRLKQMANDTSDEERAELARKLAEIDKALQEEASKTKEAQNKLNAIRKTANAEAAAERKANYEAAQARREQEIQDTVTQMEQELALYEAKSAGIQRTGEEELQYIKDKNKEELEILQYKRDKDLISELEYQTAKIQLKNQEKEKEAEIAQAELDAIEEFSAKKAALEEELYLKSLETEEERELAKLDKEFEKEEAEIERMKVSAERKQELMLLLEEQYQQNLTETQDKWEEKRIADAEKRAQQELKIREELANARLNIAQGLSGLLSAVAGEDAKIQKAALLFEKGVAAGRVIMQTQIANAKSLAASPLTGGMPWVAYNTVQMGLSLATIAAQAVSGIQGINKNSKKSNKKFGRGGLLQGASHANGGIQTPYGELEGEEAVINKKSTAKYGGLLSAINQAEGGVAIGTQRPSGLIDYDVLANKIAQANRSLPSPNVSVEEINRVGSRTTEIVERAKF